MFTSVARRISAKRAQRHYERQPIGLYTSADVTTLLQNILEDMQGVRDKTVVAEVIADIQLTGRLPGIDADHLLLPFQKSPAGIKKEQKAAAKQQKEIAKILAAKETSASAIRPVPVCGLSDERMLMSRQGPPFCQGHQ